MEPRKLSDNIEGLTDEIRNYIRLRIDLFKLNLTEKLSTLITTLFLSILFFILFLFVALFLSLAFIFWYKEHIGDAWAGSLIVAGFYLLISVVVYHQRNRLFLNRIVAQISGILIEEKEEEDEK